MKIFIDGFYLAKTRGMGRYIQELLYAIAKNDFFSNADINVLVPKSCLHTIKELHEYIKRPWINFIIAKDYPFPIWEQFVLPFYCKKLNVDIIHHPYNTKAIINGSWKNIITIHDLNFIKISLTSANLYQKLGNLYRRTVISFIKESDTIITVSERSKIDVHNILNMDAYVVPNHIDLYKKKLEDLIKNKKLCMKILGRYNITPRKYILHIGGISPHKNTKRVILAFKELNNYKDLKLVILGAEKEKFIKYLKLESEESRNIIFPGIVTDSELGCLIKFAFSLLFPSLKEGFGLPILEARAFNIPIITSNQEPMLSLGKDASIFIDPFNIEDIKNAIILLMENKNIYFRLMENCDLIFKKINSKVSGELLYKVYYNAYHKK